MPLMTLEDENGGLVKESIKDVLPLLPLKNTVLFPGVVIPITIGRDKSIKAVKDAYSGDRLVGVVAQIDSNVEEPQPQDLHQVGSVAKILKMLKMPDGSTTAIIQGRIRFKIKEVVSSEPYYSASIEQLVDVDPKDDQSFDAIMLSIRELSASIIKLSPNIPAEASIMLRNIDSPSFLLHFIANNLPIVLKEKQSLLETNDVKERAQNVLRHLESEIQLLELKNKIQNKVRTDIEKQQKDYFLQQQLKTIQEELGSGDSMEKEIKNLRERAAKKKWSSGGCRSF